MEGLVAEYRARVGEEQFQKEAYLDNLNRNRGEAAAAKSGGNNDDGKVVSFTGKRVRDVPIVQDTGIVKPGRPQEVQAQKPEDLDDNLLTAQRRLAKFYEKVETQKSIARSTDTVQPLEQSLRDVNEALE